MDILSFKEWENKNLNYFEKLKEWKTCEEVFEYIKTFKYNFPALLDTKDKLKRYGIYYPKTFTLTEMFVEKLGTCTNVYYFAVKTFNTINLDYAAFSITMTWRGGYSGVNKICLWHEGDVVKSFRWSPQDDGTLILEGPFKSLEECRDYYAEIAKKSLEPRIVPIRYGISILDVRTANDPRIRKALDFFGVDDGSTLYRKDFK
jgi:hypothetical protein